MWHNISLNFARITISIKFRVLLCSGEKTNLLQMKKVYLFIVFIYGIMSFTAAQSSSKPEIPLVRLYFHEKIDSTQKQIEKYDGTPDSKFRPSDNDELNNRINDALTTQVDALQTSIEESKQADNNDKIRYLRGLNECLQKFLVGYRYQ